MEAKSKASARTTLRHSKLEAVRLLEVRGERNVADLAASLGVAENMLHAWKRNMAAPPSRYAGNVAVRRPRKS